jgi:non-heme chloroperoxidase
MLVFDLIDASSANQDVTEIVEVLGRGHSIAIDSGWKDAAPISLDFNRRFVA